MQIVVDTRPVEALADVEIVAHLYRVVRHRTRCTAAELRQLTEELFPGLPAERLQRCAADLAQRLEAQRG